MNELRDHLEKIDLDTSLDIPENIRDKTGFLIHREFQGDNSRAVKQSREALQMNKFFEEIV